MKTNRIIVLMMAFSLFALGGEAVRTRMRGKVPFDEFPPATEDVKSLPANATTREEELFPRNPASSLSFTDEAFLAGNVSGAIEIGMASDETDVTYYYLYWGIGDKKIPGDKALIQTIPKAGHDLEYRLGDENGVSEMIGSGNPEGVPIGSRELPKGATHLLCLTSNENGEMATGPAVELIDATSEWSLSSPAEVLREAAQAAAAANASADISFPRNATELAAAAAATVAAPATDASSTAASAAAAAASNVTAMSS